MAEIRLGTSAFTAAGWEGVFYPAGMQPRDYLSYYATKFSTVEVDSTYYRTPSHKTVEGWALKTPKDFLFSVKVPQAITHEKCLVDCGPEIKEFLSTMDILGEKLGPVVFQFPYFSKEKFQSGAEFSARLGGFLKQLPGGYRFAVEIRNRAWLDARLADSLRERNVALVLQDQSWMPRPAELFEKFDPITADFAYVRWLGDRKGIEAQTKTWSKVIVDRTQELNEWLDVFKKVYSRNVPIYAYANNHFAGHAPTTVEMFTSLLAKHGLGELKSEGNSNSLPNTTENEYTNVQLSSRRARQSGLFD